MKALAYHGPGQRSWDTVADPKPTEPTDIVVRIDTTTICGTDLHILKGDDPTVEQGRVLGHEAVGTVVEVGNAVTSLRADDRVLVPAITPRRPCHGHVVRDNGQATPLCLVRQPPRLTAVHIPIAASTSEARMPVLRVLQPRWAGCGRSPAVGSLPPVRSGSVRPGCCAAGPGAGRRR